MRIPLPVLLLFLMLAALCAGCTSRHATVDGVTPGVASDVSQRVDQVVDAEVRADTAATPQERAVAKAEAKAGAKAIGTQETLENRNTLLWQAMRMIAVVAFAIVVGKEFEPLALPMRIVALSAGGYGFAALLVRSLLPHLDQVLEVAAVVVAIYLFRHAQIGHAGLEDLAKDTSLAEVRVRGKVASAVAWLRDHFAWHHAPPQTVPLAPIVQTAVATASAPA